MKPMLLVGLLFSFAAHADRPVWSYVGGNLGVNVIEFGNEDVDQGVASIGGAAAVGDYIALFGSVAAGFIDVDDCSICTDDIETSVLVGGVLLHFPVGPDADVYFPLGFAIGEVETAGFSDDDTGYTIGAGVRWRPGRVFELDVSLTHVDIADDSDQTLGGVARWHINDLFSLSAGLSIADDVTGFNGGLRFSF